jgi:hypothetical protein
MREPSLKIRVATKLKRSRKVVFLREDFEKLGGYDQVGRALRELVADGRLKKIGYGLYAKARPNRFANETMLDARGGFNEVAKSALNRLKVKWTDSEAIDAYASGSTQIPANAEVTVFGRFSRKISDGKVQLKIAKAL